MSVVSPVDVKDAEGISAISPRLSETIPGVVDHNMNAPWRVCQKYRVGFWHALQGAKFQVLEMSVGITRTSFIPRLMTVIPLGSEMA